MLKIRVIRFTPKDNKQEYTHGEMQIWDNVTGWLDFCHTLEDTVRDINKDGDLDDEGEGKIYGKTAIPFGKYKGQLRMSPKRGRLIPWIDNVPHFYAIQIHSGNNVDHSFGCILVGLETDKKGKIWKANDAEADLINLIANNDKEGRFEIEII